MFNKGTFEDKTQIRTKHTMQAKGCISTCIAIERDGCLVPGFVGQYRFFLCANHNSTGTCRSTATSQWHSRRIILRGPTSQVPLFHGPSDCTLTVDFSSFLAVFVPVRSNTWHLPVRPLLPVLLPTKDTRPAVQRDPDFSLNMAGQGQIEFVSASGRVPLCAARPVPPQR